MIIQSDSYDKTVIKIGGRSGVYFLKSLGFVIYIGKSINVLERVFAAEHKRKRFDEVEIHWMPADKIGEYEKQQIAIHKPRLNIDGLRPRDMSRFRDGRWQLH